MLRFIHAADFHLDSAFTGLNEQQARQRRQESRDLTGRPPPGEPGAAGAAG